MSKPFSKTKVLAMFEVAGFKTLNVWELVNQYWGNVPDYYQIARDSPWWLVKTDFGLIRIGWRKRVIEIDWSDTKYRGKVTDDNVTQNDTYAHAWSELDATRYLCKLNKLIKI